MRIFTRYVSSELLKVFLVSLTGITVFLLLVVVFKEAYQRGLGMKQAMLIIPYVLPEALRFAVPATILFAACSVFGRLASSNEIVAVKASGISPMVLLWPAFILAFLLSLGAVWLNDMAVSWGRDGIARVAIESIEEIAYTRLQQSRAYSSSDFSINVKDVDGHRLIQPEITFQGSGDDPPMTISCDEATMRMDIVGRTLTITCHKGILQMGSYSATFPELERVVPLDDVGSHSSRNPAELPMQLLTVEKAKQIESIDAIEQELGAKASYLMLTGGFSDLSGPNWENEQRRLTSARLRLCRLEMEPYRRWANGFSCLCFVLVGAPLAIVLRNADFLSSFFACFMPILLVYYPLLMTGIAQAKSGSIPPYSVWLGNVILAGIGLLILRRVTRY